MKNPIIEKFHQITEHESEADKDEVASGWDSCLDAYQRGLGWEPVHYMGMLEEVLTEHDLSRDSFAVQSARDYFEGWVRA